MHHMRFNARGMKSASSIDKREAIAKRIKIKLIRKLYESIYTVVSAW